MNSPQKQTHITFPSSDNEVCTIQALGTPLTVIERKELVRLEGVVRRELKAFIRVGMALLQIKRRKLYRDRFPSFEEYCYAVWGWKKSQAYRMLDAAEICSEMSPMGETFLPTNERQVRPLTGMSGERAIETWKLAVKTAAGKPVTGRIVEKAAAESAPRARPVQERSSWQVYIDPLLKQAVHMLKDGAIRTVDRKDFLSSPRWETSACGERKPA